jgi:hypothetical protein
VFTDNEWTIYEVDFTSLCTQGVGANSCSAGFEIELVIFDLKNFP